MAISILSKGGSVENLQSQPARSAIKGFREAARESVRTEKRNFISKKSRRSQSSTCYTKKSKS